MMKFLKHVSVLLVMVLLCTTMTLCSSAATIPAEGSIWKPSEAPAYEPAEPTFYPIVIEKAENGAAKSSVVSAAAGTTVTITVVPEDGFSLKQLQLVDPSGNPISFKKISDTEYTFVMPSCRVTVRSAFRPQASLCPRDESCPMYGFADLKLTAWYHDGVHYCIETGLMNGVGGNLFDPYGSTTRAMLVTVLWRLEGSPVVASAVKFDDVPAGQWYSDAIAWASANGIVNGYGDGKFGPANSLTREQVMAIFNRFVAYKSLTSEAAVETQTQYNCSAWAQNDVNWAAANGLLDDLGVDATNMTAAASRAELATYLYRVIENIMK